jgi:hypothetical protein
VDHHHVDTQYLRDWGLDASALAGTAGLLAANSRWDYGGLPYCGGEVDCCINAYTLANGACLGADVSALAQRFPGHRMADGGWNCEWVTGSTSSYFHSTLNVLKGLLYFEACTGGSDALRTARLAGQEYLLQRRLLRTLSTGELAGPWVTTFAYPFRWQYSALKAADYFLAAARHDGVLPDPRLADAIGVIRAARRPDGTWLQQHRYLGRVWSEVDVPPGDRPSGSPSTAPAFFSSGPARFHLSERSVVRARGLVSAKPGPNTPITTGTTARSPSAQGSPARSAMIPTASGPSPPTSPAALLSVTATELRPGRLPYRRA